LTLYPYRDQLSFVFEHPLNSEPLRIDVVIIKKELGAVIDNPIAAIFRETNIVEYKGPGNHLSISDFHKVGAYARLYSAQNRVETGDMSVSFVTTAHPKKLLDYVRNKYRFTVKEQRPGIYYMEGDIFPTQIIESQRLEGAENQLWLKDLRRGLNGEAIQAILERSRTMPEGAPLSAYLHTVIRANDPGVKEALAMSEASLEAVFEEFGLTAKWEAKGWEKGWEEGLQEGLEKGLKKGLKEGMEKSRQALAEKDRAIKGLRRKLRDAGMDAQ
jgi:hypothetical protein